MSTSFESDQNKDTMTLAALVALANPVPELRQGGRRPCKLCRLFTWAVSGSEQHLGVQEVILLITRRLTMQSASFAPLHCKQAPSCRRHTCCLMTLMSSERRRAVPARGS